MNVIVGVDIPMLALANEIHPLIGLLMSFSLLGMIYNTAVGMFYSFMVRFLNPNKVSFKVTAVLSVVWPFSKSRGFYNACS